MEAKQQPAASSQALAAQSKAALEQQLLARREQLAARAARRSALQVSLLAASSDADRAVLLRAAEEAERELARRERRRSSAAHFEALATIGRGAFGEVKVVRELATSKIFALKSMSKAVMLHKNQVVHVKAERDALAAGAARRLPFLVSLEAAFQTPEALHLVMDFAPGGDLMSMLIKKDVLPESLVRLMAAECTVALERLHRSGFIHRDLKPDNVLIDARGHVLLTDLGLAIKVEDEGEGAAADAVVAAAAVTSTSPPPPSEDSDAAATSSAGLPATRRALAFSTVGTPDYLAPEVLAKRGYTASVDLWSLGVVVFESLLGYPPFYADDPVATCRRILHHAKHLRFPADRVRNLSAEALAFMRALITDEATRLPDAAAVKAHAWFAGLDWARLGEGPGPFAELLPPRLQLALDELERVPRQVGKGDPALTRLVKEAVQCFDDIDALPASDPRAAQPQMIAAAGPSRHARFPAFTFRRGEVAAATAASAASVAGAGSAV